MTPSFCLILPLISSFTHPPRKKGSEVCYCDPSVLATGTPTLCQSAGRGAAAAWGHRFGRAASGGGRQAHLATSCLPPAPFQLPLAPWQWRGCRSRPPAQRPCPGWAAHSHCSPEMGAQGKPLSGTLSRQQPSLAPTCALGSSAVYYRGISTIKLSQ